MPFRSAVAKYLKADGEQELSGLSTLQQAFVAGSQALLNPESNGQKVLNVLSRCHADGWCFTGLHLALALLSGEGQSLQSDTKTGLVFGGQVKNDISTLSIIPATTFSTA